MKKEDFIKAVEYFEFQPPEHEDIFQLKVGVDGWIKAIHERTQDAFDNFNSLFRSYLLKEGDENHPYISKDMVVSFIKVESINVNFQACAMKLRYSHPMIFFRVNQQIRYPKKEPVHYRVGEKKQSDRWDYMTTSELFFGK